MNRNVTTRHNINHPAPQSFTFQTDKDLYDILKLLRICTTGEIEKRYFDLTGCPYPLATDKKFLDIHVAARLLHCNATRKLYDVAGIRIISELMKMCRFISEMSPLKYAMSRKEPLAKKKAYAHDNDILDQVKKKYPELFAHGEL